MTAEAPRPLFDGHGYGKALRVRLAELHIGVREAADRIGVSKATVSRVANCRAPDVESYLRINAWLQRTAPPPFGSRD